MRTAAPTRDADDAAALLPLGGSEYGHKGYALALMIDLLCGPLNGMPYADRIAPMFADLQARRHLGSLVMALDPMRFAGGPTLATTVRELIATLRRQPGDVQYPGEPEERREAVRAREGIPVEPGLWAEFADWSTRLGVAIAGGSDEARPAAGVADPRRRARRSSRPSMRCTTCGRRPTARTCSSGSRRASRSS